MSEDVFILQVKSGKFATIRCITASEAGNCRYHDGPIKGPPGTPVYHEIIIESRGLTEGSQSDTHCTELKEPLGWPMAKILVRGRQILCHCKVLTEVDGSESTSQLDKILFFGGVWYYKLNYLCFSTRKHSVNCNFSMMHKLNQFLNEFFFSYWKI